MLTTIFDRTVYDSGARFLFTDGSFASIDPYAEKYPWISPYAYCAGNPINLADPDGRDVYSYNKQTGVFSLIKTTDDNYDSVVKQNKNGDIKKTLIKNVEKGILCDGANFMTKENVIEVNKKNAPSLEGVERFTIDLTRVAGKEIAGAYYSEKGDGVVSHISIGRYDVNETHRSNNPGTNSLGHMFGPGYEQHITGLYHTHPQDRHYSWEQRKSPSDTDKKSKMNQLQFFPHISFYILTQPEYGVNEYKFQY